MLFRTRGGYHATRARKRRGAAAADASPDRLDDLGTRAQRRQVRGQTRCERGETTLVSASAEPPLCDWPRWFEGLHAATATRPSGLDQDTYQRLQRAREFIDGHQHESIDLDDIARQACFSRFHFLRLFRRAFGETPHRYLTQARLARARNLLVSSDLSVTEICFEVGFQSVGSFSTLFQRQLGHPPTRYRARIFPVPGTVSRGLPLPIPSCFLAMYATRAA